MNSNAIGLPRQALIVKLRIASVLIFIWAAGCTSTPSETPEKFVLNFIQKLIPMNAQSVADFYVKVESN